MELDAWELLEYIPGMTAAELDTLTDRFGRKFVGQRMAAQSHMVARFFGSGRSRVHYENVPLFSHIVRSLLKATGLYRFGQRNALNFMVKESSLFLPHLPTRFDGFRIIQLSDLHIDGHEQFSTRLAEELRQLPCDLCVLCGDYRFYDTGRYEHLTGHYRRLVESVQSRHGVVGIMGNHDILEMIPLLESTGIRMLVNESMTIESSGESLTLTGLDDPHYYGLHDFQRVETGQDSSSFRILLVHSPEVIPEAYSRGYPLVLTGHTHGGQICLPGGTAIVRNARAPRRFCAGPWQYHTMIGYTSPGTGSSGVFARFNCPPEITVHTLYSSGGHVS